MFESKIKRKYSTQDKNLNIKNIIMKCFYFNQTF